MNWNAALYALPLALAATISIPLSFYMWRRRSAPGATIFAITVLALTEWTLVYALELLATDLPDKIFWAKLQYPGIVVVPVGWLIFTLRWSGRVPWQRWGRVAPLLVIPAITLALVWTNEAHGLIWQEIELYTAPPLTTLKLGYGPWFLVHSLYSHLLMLAGAVVLLRQAPGAPRLYRRQRNMLLLAVLLPTVSNALYLLGYSPIPYVDLAPFSLTIAGLGVAWSLYGLRLLDLTPVARDVLIETMRDGVIVLDLQRRIVDLNPAAQAILGHTSNELVGQTLASALPAQTARLTQAIDGGDAQASLTLGPPEGPAIYDLTVSRLHSRRGATTGYLLVLRDMTERVQAEAALRVSEERYRIVSELTSDYTYAMTVSARGSLELEWVTDAFTSVTGFNVEEVIARGGWSSLVHPDDLPIARTFAANVMAGLSDVSDFRIVTKHGATRWIRNYGKPIWNVAENRVVRLLGAGRDITVRTEAMAALRESEQRYRLLFERTPHPMWVYDVETLRFLAVNQAAVRHYGYSEAEFLAMTVKDIRPAADVPRLLTYIAHHQLSSDGSGTWRHCKHDGTLIDVEIMSHPITFAGRQAKVVQVHDITEQRQVELALRQQNEYLAALHETTLTVMNRLEVSDLLEAIVVRAGSLVGTAHGYIYLAQTDAATGATELEVAVGVGTFRPYIGFRLQPGEGLAGTVWETRQPLVIDDYDRWAGRAPHFSYGIYHAGVCVPLTSGAQIVGVIGMAYLEQGRTFGANEVTILSRFAQLASIALDNARLYTTAQQEIAERTRAEADLALARDQALEAARLKSEFLAIMSHELRTPLNAIIGFTDLTLSHQMGPLNEHQQSALQRVVRNARHLLEMINGLLDLSKLDANAMQLAHAPVRIEDVVTIAISSIETLVTNKGLRLMVRRPPEPLPLVLGDAGRLQQIVMNLLSNAVKFTPPSGAIMVTLEHGTAETLEVAAPPAQPLTGAWLALSVQDTGIGIPPEEHERIWSEFYQVDGSATRQYGGSGLGLAIVKRMTLRMGGQVGLRSMPDDGATFTIWLPPAGVATPLADVPEERHAQVLG